MIRFLLIICTLILTADLTLAVEIVYPKKNPVTINASSTFFIGSVSAGESLKINDTDIKISPNGAFAQFVPLVEGFNEFKIISQKETQNEIGSETLNFVINRPIKTAATNFPATLIEYPQSVYLKVKNDNTPLRATPFDSGLNRLSHLPKNLTLKINGEKGIFYMANLNSTSNAWILKSDLEPSLPNDLVKIESAKIERKDGFCIINFEVSNTPLYTLKEEENKLTLKLYNVSSPKENKLDTLTSTFNDNTFTLEAKLEQKLIGYDIDVTANQLTLKIREPLKLDKKSPLKDVAIVIDPGHGGAEYGAIGGCGHKEKDINLDISKKLSTELENNGAKVFMTRKTDTTVSLVERAQFIKNKNAVISISIHANALPDGLDPNTKQGTSVYYYHNQAKQLAQNILNSMLLTLNTKDDKIRQASLALVRPTGAVSILIEVGYIINPEDYNLLLDPIFQQNCANAIVEGIKNYLINQ